MNPQLDRMKKFIFPVEVVVLLQGRALTADWLAWRGSLGDATVNDPDGHLEISKYEEHVDGSVDRCNLETRFEGKRLLAYFPASNPKSSFKVFFPQEGFPVPFIYTKDFRQPSLFSYRKGAEATID
jgi:hypothetical protein